MDYVIKNQKGLYIRLSENGKATTCSESNKGIFEYSKAKNVLDNLPKTLKKLKFYTEAIPEIALKEKKDIIKEEVIKRNNIEIENTKKEEYVPLENITRWVEKFGVCSDILEEAKETEKRIVSELDQVDKELLDLLHIIEIEKTKDLYSAWKLYKSIKSNRQKRRNKKDELLIVENVLKDVDPKYLRRERVQKAIDGLLSRKYTFRVVEEVEDADL